MPELPEVEVVRRGLAGWVVGRTVASTRYLGERVIVLSSSPTVILDDLHIDLPAERDQLETRSDPRFVELRHHVYEQIQKAKTYTGDTNTIRTVA